MNNLYLIGGAPCAGKSTLAKALAKKIGGTFVSTDVVRDWLKNYLPKDKYTALFDCDGYTAEAYYEKYNLSEITAHQNAESEVVFEGFNNLLKADYVSDCVVAEGIAILPSLVSKIVLPGTKIHTVFIADIDEDRILSKIRQRGLWTGAADYSNEIKPMEAKWVLNFAQWLEAECKRYGLPYIQIGTYEDLEKQIEDVFELA